MRFRLAVAAACLVAGAVASGATAQAAGTSPSDAGNPPAAPVPAGPPADSSVLLAGPEPLSASFRTDAARAESAKGPGPLKAFFQILLSAYREGVSPVDGPSCPFHPSCSRFAREAIRVHGLVPGVIKTGDRLMRCNGSGRERYPRLPDGSLHDPP